MSIGRSSITQLASIKDDNTIDVLFTDKGKTIKKVGNNSNEADNINIVAANKIANSKDQVKARAGFFIPGARSAFTKLK